MGTIVKLDESIRKQSHTLAHRNRSLDKQEQAHTSAEIILFPGIRVEYHTSPADENASAEHK